MAGTRKFKHTSKDPRVLRYYFNKGERYIETEQKLNQEEENILSKILASFPTSNHKINWPEKFIVFAIEESDKIPKKLLSLAANAHDAWGNTMLGIVSENGMYLQVIQWLIDMGADLNTPDNDNKLALHWAISNRLSQRMPDSYVAAQSVKCLLDNGARTDITCYQSATPFEYAKKREFKAAARLLEEFVAKTYTKGSNSLLWQCAKNLSKEEKIENITLFEKFPRIPEIIKKARPFR